MTATSVEPVTLPPPEVRESYGEGKYQFGELRMPDGAGPHPIAIVVHGGCWCADNDLGYMRTVAAAFARAGLATWSLEYRRIGNDGGGWPGTFEDIAAGADHLRELGRRFPLDLGQVLAIGHSAGGHLALWLAARWRLGKDQPLYRADPLPIAGVLGLAPAADLALLHRRGLCGSAIDKLMGGSPKEVPERYRAGCPMELLPLGVPQVLAVGDGDRVWSRVARRYFDKAVEAGDDVQILRVDPCEHFKIIDPAASSWPFVREAALCLLGR